METGETMEEPTTDEHEYELVRPVTVAKTKPVRERPLLPSEFEEVLLRRFSYWGHSWCAAPTLPFYAYGLSHATLLCILAAVQRSRLGQGLGEPSLARRLHMRSGTGF